MSNLECPYCDHMNIEGVDTCEHCGQSLHGVDVEEPVTDVERSLATDVIAVMEPKIPVTVADTTRVETVLGLMIQKWIGCVLVCDSEGQPVGIFSERDALLKLGADASQHFDQPISKFMTSDPQTLSRGDKVAFAVRSMDQGSFRHVPIVDDAGKLDGIISVRDILDYLTVKMA